MKIYIDLVFFLNFFFDLLLLTATATFLKRQVPIKRLLWGSLMGSITLVVLFWPMSSFTLFLFKVGTSLLMIEVTFQTKPRRKLGKEILYFYFSSMLLGGILYFVKDQSTWASSGFLLFEKEEVVPYAVVLLVALFLFRYYGKMISKHSKWISRYHKLKIPLGNEMLYLTAYYDTGNQLVDPYHHRPILLVFHPKIQFAMEDAIFVPYQTLEHRGVILCRQFPTIFVDDQAYHNVLIGASKEAFSIPNAEAILPNDFF